MELVEIATVTSKGQLTVPASIREIFNLEKGSTVIFKVTDKGVLFMPGEIMAKDSYTQDEWVKIKRLVAERGKAYKSARSARNHIESL
jgi:AbrB family looped-hinge helix DNA binding protein